MIISNATPLIAFARIRQLSLFEKVVGNILIPQAVANEIMTHTTSPYSGIIDISQEVDDLVSYSKILPGLLR